MLERRGVHTEEAYLWSGCNVWPLGFVVRARFLMPVSDASYQFEMVLDDVQRDAWPVPSDQRVSRCTGVALQVMSIFFFFLLLLLPLLPCLTPSVLGPRLYYVSSLSCHPLCVSVPLLCCPGLLKSTCAPLGVLVCIAPARCFAHARGFRHASMLQCYWFGSRRHFGLCSSAFDPIPCHTMVFLENWRRLLRNSGISW